MRLKLAKTYPVQFDSLAAFNPHEVTPNQRSNIMNYVHQDLREANELGMTLPNTGYNAVLEAARTSKEPMRASFSASKTQALPETQRRMLGLLPPKIPVREPSQYHVSDMGQGIKVLGGNNLAESNPELHKLLQQWIQNKYEQGIYDPKKVKEEYTMDPSPTRPRSMNVTTVKNANAIDFKWAEEGSMELLDQEFDRILKSAIDPAIAASSVGGKGTLQGVMNDPAASSLFKPNMQPSITRFPGGGQGQTMPNPIPRIAPNFTAPKPAQLPGAGAVNQIMTPGAGLPKMGKDAGGSAFFPVDTASMAGGGAAPATPAIAKPPTPPAAPKAGPLDALGKGLGAMAHTAGSALSVPKPPPAPEAPKPPAVTAQKPGPIQGAMDTVKDYGNKAMSQFNGMPTWGQGALIGGGIGALGGMLSDKKKRLRGLLQGALVGGGLGALGGYGYQHLTQKPKGDTPPPVDPAAAGGGEKAPAPESGVGKVISKVKDQAGTIGGYLGDAIQSPVTIGLGMGAAGRSIANSGNKVVHTVGAKDNPAPGNRGTVQAVPNTKDVLNMLANDGEGLNAAIQRLALKNRANLGSGTPLVVDPMQTQDNLINFKTQPTAGKANAPRTFNIGRTNVLATPQEVAKSYQDHLAESTGKSSLPTAGRARAGLAARAVGGNLLGGAGLATAGYGVLDGLGKMFKGNNTLEGMNPGPATTPFVDNVINMVKGSPDALNQIKAFGERSGWDLGAWLPYIQSKVQ